ncbi:hypothetical protein Aduo_008896 [Ancylostoma duodenale]
MQNHAISSERESPSCTEANTSPLLLSSQSILMVSAESSDGLESRSCEPSSATGAEMAHYMKSNGRVRVSRVYPAVASPPSTMQLSWHGVTVHVDQRRFWHRCLSAKARARRETPIMVLNKVNGVAKPGELLAIMGASGAGKTCLLNVLASRNLNNMEVEGSVRVNQQPVTKDFMRKACAYVQQDDCFIGSLTVKEHLVFNAILRMGGGYRSRRQLRKVEEVMSELGLDDCADSIIGTRSIKGISGGEKKRVAFASEILTSPPILLCDEPTSGLDSFLALQVIHVLKQLARTKSMTIIFTIHQPSSQVFQLFDRIYMMAEGRVAFCGSQAEAIEFWTSIGRPLPRNFNPSDHFISSLADQDGPRRNTAAQICDAYEQGPLGSNIWGKDQTDVSHSGNFASLESIMKTYSGSGRKSRSVQVSASCVNQIRALHWRNTMSILREPTLLKVQIVQSIVIAALTGVFYLNDSYTQEKVANINGSLFQMVVNMAFMFQFAVVNHFCSEIHTFYREYGSGLYSAGSYFIAKNLAELPNFTLSAVIFASILYWMSRLVPLWQHFLFYLLVAVLVQNTAISIGYAVGCIFASVSIAVAVLPIFVVPMMAFGGFYVNQASLPWFFYPFKYLSYFGYAYESLVVNEWTTVNSISGCPRPDGVHCYENGTDVITSLSFAPEHMWTNVIIIASMIIAIRFLAFMGLWTRAKLQR